MSTPPPHPSPPPRPSSQVNSPGQLQRAPTPLRQYSASPRPSSQVNSPGQSQQASTPPRQVAPVSSSSLAATNQQLTRFSTHPPVNRTILSSRDVSVVLDNRLFTNSASLAQHIRSTYQKASRSTIINILDSVQAQVQDIHTGLDSFAFEAVEFANEVTNGKITSTESYRERYKPILTRHKREGKVRKRLEEDYRRLRGWVSPFFIQRIIETQSRVTTALLDALNASHVRQYFTPLEVYQRASLCRLARIANLSNAGGDRTNPYITPGDITQATLHPRQPLVGASSDNHGRALLLSTTQQLNFQEDGYGIAWLGGPPPIQELAPAYSDAGRLQDSPSRAQTLPPTPQAPPSGPTTNRAAIRPPQFDLDLSLETSTSIEPESDTRSYNLRAPKDGAPDYSNAQRAVRKPTGKVQQPASTSNINRGDSPTHVTQAAVQDPFSVPSGVKRPRSDSQSGVQTPSAGNLNSNQAGRSTPSKGAKRLQQDQDVQSYETLLGKFKHLHVNTKGSPGTAKAIQVIPITNPTVQEEALWKLISKKAYKVATEGRTSFSQQDEEQLLQTPDLESITRVFDRIGKALNDEAAKQDRPATMAAYIEGAMDTAQIQFQVWDRRFRTADRIRQMILQVQSHLGANPIREHIGDASIHGMAESVDARNFATLLLDDHHTGWLDDAVINASILATMEANPLYRGWLVNSAQFSQALGTPTAQTDNLLGQIRLPRQGNYDLYIPVNLRGSHWALIMVDYNNQRIHYMDSQHDSVTQRLLIDTTRRLLNRHSDYSQINWTESTLRSHQQTNMADCGVIVIENAIAAIESRPPRSPDHTLRRVIAEHLFDSIMATSSYPPVPRQPSSNTPRQPPPPNTPRQPLSNPESLALSELIEALQPHSSATTRQDPPSPSPQKQDTSSRSKDDSQQSKQKQDTSTQSKATPQQSKQKQGERKNQSKGAPQKTPSRKQPPRQSKGSKE